MNRQSAAKSDIILKPFPISLNGFENKYHDVTKEEFINEVIPTYIIPLIIEKRI